MKKGKYVPVWKTPKSLEPPASDLIRLFSPKILAWFTSPLKCKETLTGKYTVLFVKNVAQRRNYQIAPHLVEKVTGVQKMFCSQVGYMWAEQSPLVLV